MAPTHTPTRCITTGLAPGTPAAPPHLQGMPAFCGKQLEPALQRAYNASLLPKSGQGAGQGPDLCATLCGGSDGGSQECAAGDELLPRLELLRQLPNPGSALWALAAEGSGDGSDHGNEASGSPSSEGQQGRGQQGKGQQGNATSDSVAAPAGAPAEQEESGSAAQESGSGVNVAAAVAGAAAGSGECGPLTLPAGGLLS